MTFTELNDRILGLESLPGVEFFIINTDRYQSNFAVMEQRIVVFTHIGA